MQELIKYHDKIHQIIHKDEDNLNNLYSPKRKYTSFHQNMNNLSITSSNNSNILSKKKSQGYLCLSFKKNLRSNQFHSIDIKQNTDEQYSRKISESYGIQLLQKKLINDFNSSKDIISVKEGLEDTDLELNYIQEEKQSSINILDFTNQQSILQDSAIQDMLEKLKKIKKEPYKPFVYIQRNRLRLQQQSQSSQNLILPKISQRSSLILPKVNDKSRSQPYNPLLNSQIFQSQQLTTRLENKQEKYILDDEFSITVRQIQKKMRQFQIQIQNKNQDKVEINKLLHEMIELSYSIFEQNHDKLEFYLIILGFAGLSMMEFSDFNQACIHYKNLRLVQNTANLRNMKIQSYINIADCFILLNKYSKALVFLKKLLKLSWFINDNASELIAYDKIGICYYYMGQTQVANFYHNRLVQGLSEPQDSAIRKIGIQSYKIKKKMIQQNDIEQNNTDSEDDYDLNQIYKTYTQKNSKKEQDQQQTKNKYTSGSLTNFLDSQLQRLDQKMQMNLGPKFLSDAFKPKEELIQTQTEISKKILINHLSPNRFPSNYENLAMKNNIQNIDSQINFQLKNDSILKLIKESNKILEKIKFTLKKL